MSVSINAVRVLLLPNYAQLDLYRLAHDACNDAQAEDEGEDAHDC